METARHTERSAVNVALNQNAASQTAPGPERAGAPLLINGTIDNEDREPDAEEAVKQASY